MDREMYFIFISIALVSIFGLTTMVVAANPQVNIGIPISNGIFNLNDSTVNLAISTSPFFVLDCYVTWCESCTAMSSAFYELARGLGGQLNFGMIDLENNSITEKKYNISSFPTILIFKNGLLIDRQEGYGSKEELLDLIKIDDPGLNTNNIEIAAPYQQPVSHLRSNTTQMTTLAPIRNLMPDKHYK